MWLFRVVALFLFQLHICGYVSCDGNEPIGTDGNETIDAVDDSTDEGNVEIIGTESEEENLQKFVPTDQWQPILKGQTIPAGLHVRLNIQTGEREAKLLEKDADSSHGKQLASVEALPESEQRQMTHVGEKSDDSETPKTKDELYREFLEKQLKQTYEKSIRRKHRTKEELKAILERGGLRVKSEMEMLAEACNLYRTAEGSTEDQRLLLLRDIEFYVHQIDSAKNFAKSGDLEMVIRSLNDSSDRIRSVAALVVGSAVQSNAEVQLKAIEAGALPHLVRMLATETRPQLCLHAVYATSALLRHFPLAQYRFVQLGGIHTLPRLLALENGDGRLKVKVISFVDDLLTERLNVEMEGNRTEEDTEKLRQYQRFDLFDSLSQLDWCSRIPPLLSLATEHDSREKIAAAMWSLRAFCHDTFRGAVPILSDLREEYRGLATEELREDGTPGYFHDVHVRFADLISAFTNDRRAEL